MASSSSSAPSKEPYGALTQIANLEGDDILGKNEASCIKEIADKILWQMPIEASEFRNSCVGIESRISEIKKLMDGKPNEVLCIGLWGMGGIDKTTTAKAIFEEHKDEFEVHCFLQDVRQIDDILENLLHKKLLRIALNTKSNYTCDGIEGSNVIEERLHCKKILLVVDNLDDEEQLNVLVKQCDFFCGGSRIIITTRDAHLLNGDHIENYEVQTLPENIALHLFCLHAFMNDRPDEDFEELSLQVLSYAAGLPLALQVLGHHLHGKDKWFWEDALEKLKTNPNKEIISKLRISFNKLDDSNKDIFLDIACFFRGKSKGEVEE